MSTFVGGKLKLKGGVDVAQLKGGVKKKRRAKGKKTADEEDAAADAQALVPVDGGEGAKEEEGGNGAPGVVAVTREGAVLDPSAVKDRRTEAEKAAEAHFLKYEEQRVKKAAAKSHRERIQEMNEKLANLTEHYDLFRTSYTA